VFAVAGLALALFARELIEILAPDFDRAYEAAGLVLLGVAMYSLSVVAMTGITYVRRTVIIAVGAVGAAALNIGLNFVLIPPLGQVGAGIATAVAYAAMAVAYYVVSQRLYPTPGFEPGKVVAIVLLAAAIGTIGVIPIDPLGVALLVKSLALGAFLVALALMGAVSRPELARLRQLAGAYVGQQRA
jgi:O-antigen/teichoic acid export membrane protein